MVPDARVTPPTAARWHRARERIESRPRITRLGSDALDVELTEHSNDLDLARARQRAVAGREPISPPGGIPGGRVDDPLVAELSGRTARGEQEREGTEP